MFQKVNIHFLGEYKQRLLDQINLLLGRLSLRWKIYLSLAGILLPVFSLTIFIQTKLTRPLLEEEVRQIGISVCRSLSTDISAYRLLLKPDQLESRLIEMTWLQPSLVRLNVILKDGNKVQTVASNIDEGDSPFDYSALTFDETPRSELKKDPSRGYWEIVYPIKDHRKIIAYIYAEVSLQLASQIVGTFSKISFLGAMLSIALLIGLLSYYLRLMIENEGRLRKAESENVELAEQLHETQRQLFLNEKLAIMGQLTASFAHEIGTPLNSLSGHLQLLHDEVKEPTSQSRLETINSQVSRIEGIVKDFLASTHSPPQQRQLVDIEPLIQRIYKLVAPRLAALRVSVSIHVQKDLEPIRVVPTDIEQVLLNLTNNAIDALMNSVKAKELSFTAEQLAPNRHLVITVRDSGEGISQEDLKQVLKPFFTTKAPGQGTGLGLTISQRIVKKYGGRLEIDSALGKGTQIKVIIPYDAT